MADAGQPSARKATVACDDSIAEVEE